jgi:hypothetical protein
MNDHRQSAIEGLFRLLHETRDDLLSGRRGCGYECSSIMYGVLSKQMQSDALLSPRSAAPYPSLSYKSLVQRVSSFNHQSGTVCHPAMPDISTSVLPHPSECYLAS